MGNFLKRVECNSDAELKEGDKSEQDDSTVERQDKPDEDFDIEFCCRISGPISRMIVSTTYIG